MSTNRHNLLRSFTDMNEKPTPYNELPTIYPAHVAKDEKVRTFHEERNKKLVKGGKWKVSPLYLVYMIEKEQLRRMRDEGLRVYA